MDYICRKLTVEDIDMVMEMNKNFREFINRECAIEFLEDEKNWLWAAIMNDTVIGFAYGYELKRLDNRGKSGGKMLYVHEVGVVDTYQRKGVGYKMMNDLKIVLNERGIGRYFLTCYQNNEGANALYKKLGGIVPEESQGNDTVYLFFTAE